VGMDERVGESDRDELDLRIHHVGYAVESIAGYLERFLTPVFRPRSVSPVVEDPIQKVRVAFVELPGGLLELIEPTDASSPVQQIIKRGRGGLYHLCYSTTRFDLAVDRMIKNGCRALSRPVPAAAFGQKRLVFLMTPYFDVIELVETDKAAEK
jgi:methylmalonyl-CoA/ethylmalonyl-CoA epimerase